MFHLIGLTKLLCSNNAHSVMMPYLAYLVNVFIIGFDTIMLVNIILVLLHPFSRKTCGIIMQPIILRKFNSFGTLVFVMPFSYTQNGMPSNSSLRILYPIAEEITAGRLDFRDHSQRPIAAGM